MFVAMTVKEAIQYISAQLKPICNEGEATAIARLVIENLAECSKSTSTGGKEILSDEQKEKLETIVQRLLTHEPVQYVLNEAWFCGLKFYTDKNVLIPRPETEELVEWIISNCRFPVNRLKILDIGTGSGCIAVSLKRRIRKAEVWSCDISTAALEVARRNAAQLGTDINFIEMDFLDSQQRDLLPSFDIIVSNPPYVPENNKAQMQQNVLNYEPNTALFVPDNDPLIFYRAIADFGKKHLIPGGGIYLEIHEDLGSEVTALLKSAGYYTELKKDMQQKDRMIKSGLL